MSTQSTHVTARSARGGYSEWYASTQDTTCEYSEYPEQVLLTAQAERVRPDEAADKLADIAAAQVREQM